MEVMAGSSVRSEMRIHGTLGSPTDFFFQPGPGSTNENARCAVAWIIAGLWICANPCAAGTPSGRGQACQRGQPSHLEGKRRGEAISGKLRAVPPSTRVHFAARGKSGTAADANSRDVDRRR